jgi:hypothetical protein
MGHRTFRLLDLAWRPARSWRHETPVQIRDRGIAFSCQPVLGNLMKPSPALVAILLISMAIAAIAPFDVAFTAATFGSPALRMALIAALVLIGAFSASNAGLQLVGHGTRWPLLVGAAAAVGVAIYVVAIDCFIFRRLLPGSYVHFLQMTPLRDRLIYFMLRAFNENVLYRLFAFSTIVYLASLLRGVTAAGQVSMLIWGAMIATQMLNIGMNVIAPSSSLFSPMLLSYDALRYVVPGVVWAWLYWRYGFLTAEIASVGSHLVLQPALGAFL